MPGAAVAAILALVSLISLYLTDTYRPGVVGTGIYFLLGILYFALAGRKKLVLSPEEEFAMSPPVRSGRARRGHPRVTPA